MKNAILSTISVLLLSSAAVACAAENEPKTDAPVAQEDTSSSFNFSIPGDEAATDTAGAGFNFSVPGDDSNTNSSVTGLGGVAVTADESIQLEEFESDLLKTIE
jgi:hypothetical protein